MYEQFYQMIAEAREWMYDDPQAFIHYVEGALTMLERLERKRAGDDFQRALREALMGEEVA